MLCLLVFQFTMEGAGTPETRGMNYRALDELFSLRDARSVDTTFEVRARVRLSAAACQCAMCVRAAFLCTCLPSWP